MGIYRYVPEEMDGAMSTRLAPQLREPARRDACPFLLNEACAIHLARPMACRLFNVFGQICAESEDACHTRRDEVPAPPAASKTRALDKMPAQQGVAGAAARAAAIGSGAVHRLARNLRELPWENLAARLQGHEKKQS